MNTTSKILYRPSSQRSYHHPSFSLAYHNRSFPIKIDTHTMSSIRSTRQSTAKYRSFMLLLLVAVLTSQLFIGETVAFCQTQPRQQLASAAPFRTRLFEAEDNSNNNSDENTVLPYAVTNPPEDISRNSNSNPNDKNIEEEDSPVMAIGRKLKPLNDVINAVLRSNISTPFLLLLPALCNPKVQAKILALIQSTTQ